MTEKSKLSKLLITAGFTPRVAKALAWVIHHGTGTITSRELEQGADLRQPEVVFALRVLSDQGWLTVTETKKREGLGRPFSQYSVIRDKAQSFAEIEKMMNAKTSSIRETLEQIRTEIFQEQAA